MKTTTLSICGLWLEKANVYDTEMKKKLRLLRKNQHIKLSIIYRVNRLSEISDEYDMIDSL